MQGLFTAQLLGAIDDRLRKITDAGLPLKGKASSPAKMPTFSARLSTSHFPGHFNL
jgi:hypothetical protein